MTSTNLLAPGDRFPTVPVAVAGGDPLVLPDALAGHFGVVLLLRGAWCPYCTAQLRAFQRAQARLAELGVRVVALSGDDEATTAQLVADHKLSFPVGHSADAVALHDAVGAFVNPIRRTCSRPDSSSTPTGASS